MLRTVILIPILALAAIHPAGTQLAPAAIITGAKGAEHVGTGR